MMKLTLTARHLHGGGSGRVAPRLGLVCSTATATARPSVSCYRAMASNTTTTRDLSSTPPLPPIPTPPIIGPIVTFFSPSPQRSRSAVEFLNKLFHLPQIHMYNIKSSDSETGKKSRDCLDELHFGKDSSSSSSWDSIACACPTSGTILHFLSYCSGTADGRQRSRSIDDVHSPLHLIAIHGSSALEQCETTSNTHYRSAMIECRRRLAEALQSEHIIPHSFASTFETRVRGLLFYVMCNVMGREPQPNWIIPTRHSTTPILDLTPLFPSIANNASVHSIDDEHRCNHTDCTGKLREIVLPFFPGVSLLQTTLSQSSLLRPLPGLYQFQIGSENGRETIDRTTNKSNAHSLIIRPLPAAQEDLRLSSPSLVFQCKSLVDAQTMVEEQLSGRTSKIGWRGNGQLGSLIVSHPSITGLDVRICETTGDEWVLSSSFDESQDSLLAGSLAELQSVHVVSEGKHEEKASTKGDKNTANGDCWVEFRSNVKHPSGFFKQFASATSLISPPLRVAKPPDLPYD
ncbi:hypothetical protein ACHAWU_001125 [Discostella pseudostelligera]|uniref:Uncharacterized protein n=1 Tax=Discostella pseudostelligera TaxID=259834 RepID=A0ABD3MGD4_9STRA